MTTARTISNQHTDASYPHRVVVPRLTMPPKKSKANKIPAAKQSRFEHAFNHVGQTKPSDVQKLRL